MKDTPFPGAVYWKGGPSASDRTLCLGTECPNPGCKGELSLQSVSTSLHLFIRKCIRKYASAWAKCDDQFCTSHVNIVSVYGGRCPNSSCAGLLNLGVSIAVLFGANLRD